MNKTSLLQRWVAGFAVFLLILSNLALIPQVGQAATLEQAVTIKAIDANGEVVLPLTAVDFEDGETAYDVLLEAGEKTAKEIDVTVHDTYGAFINSIGGISPEGSAYWSFNVNGVSASTGISSHQVTNGENILFAITEWPSSSVTAKVSAIGKDGVAVIPETEVSLMEGASAYDALVQAGAKHQQLVHSSVDSEYFTFINNIGSIALGPNDYWSIAVNDGALFTSATARTLAENDHVQLTLETYVPPTDPGTEQPTSPDGPEEEQPTVPDAPEGEQPTSSQEPTDPTDPAEPTNPTNQNVDASVADILTYIDKNNISFAYGSEWWVWGVANTTREIPASYVASVKEKVKELEGNLRIFDLEKVIIGLSAAGEDATSIEGYNLVDLLVNHANLANPSINMNIYALLAVDSGQYETPEGFREAQVNAILAGELEQGGWSFFGSNPSPDITGMALTALAPYRDQANVQAAIERAVDYLSKAQSESGGFDIAMNGGDASESLSSTIVGLASVGVNPAGDTFTKAGGNLIQHLLKFKQDDGGYSHLQNGTSSGMATQQALLALTAYQSFVNGGGLVYQFELAGEEEPPSETEQPDVPEQPVNNPDQPEEQEQSEQPGDLEQAEQPGDLEQSEQPDQSAETEQPENEQPTTTETAESSKTGNDNGRVLPNTATNHANMILVGFGLLLVGSILFYVRRKRVA
jgi:LPXTG-motif cell wall-anchored protein